MVRVVAACLFLGVVAGAAYYVSVPTAQELLPTVSSEGQEQFVISVDDTPFTVTLAADAAARAQGLSGVRYLPEGEGKLFIFEESAPHSFWMKDMYIAIDILWFDAAGELVHAVENADPQSYPLSFVPPLPATYVLEVPAGSADAYSLTEGSQMEFSEALQRCLENTCFIK